MLEKEFPFGRWNALQRELGQKLSERLFESVVRQPISVTAVRTPVKSWSLTFAYALAVAIYATSAIVGVIGIALIASWSNLFQVLIGALLVLLCFACRPRFADPPEHLLSRAEYPMLYQLNDRIALAMGTRGADGLAVSADFGANYRIAGWTRKRYIELGAPLLAILSPGERVAVFSHELSHGANGDPLRVQFLHGAVNTLVTWAIAIRPVSIGHLGAGMPWGGLVSLIGTPFEFLMLAVSELLFLVVKGFLLLVLRESQRAEYLADMLAAGVAGTREMQLALEKTYLFEVVDAAIRAHALTQAEGSLDRKLADIVRAVPESELMRYRTESKASNWQVDHTHPPTAMRIDMLSAQPHRIASKLTSEAEERTLESEIASLFSSVQRELIDRKIEASYG